MQNPLRIAIITIPILALTPAPANPRRENAARRRRLPDYPPRVVDILC